MKDNKRCIAVITAAGSGKRMLSSVKKQFMELNGVPILAYTLEKFQNLDEIDGIVLVLPKEDMDFCKTEIVEKYKFTKVLLITEGGKERQESVFNGLKAAEYMGDVFLIHDGVRPFVKKGEILEVLESALKNGVAVLGARVKDSIRYFDGEKSCTVLRDNLWNVQTPQAFLKKIIIDAHKKAKEEGFVGTDDAVLAERLGYKVEIVEGSHENIKITTQIDVFIGEAYLKAIGMEEK